MHDGLDAAITQMTSLLGVDAVGHEDQITTVIRQVLEDHKEALKSMKPFADFGSWWDKLSA